MEHNDPQRLIEKLRHLLGIDLDDVAVRQRAWRRIRVYQEIAEQCEINNNKHVAAMLRRICRNAISGETDERSLIALTLLAGLDQEDDIDAV